MTAKHTSKSWRYEPSTKTIRTTPENYWIATLDSWDGMVNNEANAKLISSAPELLETLHGTMKALSRMIDKHDPDSIEAEWIGNAHEVLHKATGGYYKNANEKT